MSGTVAKTLIKWTRAIWDTEDPMYRSMVADLTGIPNPTIVKPTDFNNGVYAGMLEWNRQLTLTLLKQIDLSQASSKWLDYITQNHIGINRSKNETDSHFVNRVQEYIIGKKISPGAIIYFTRQFSPNAEPIIEEGIQDGAFADLSFTDIYTGFRNTVIGDQFDWYVFPAIATNSTVAAYFFVLILEGTSSDDIPMLFDYVNRWIGSGIGYEIRIIP